MNDYSKELNILLRMMDPSDNSLIFLKNSLKSVDESMTNYHRVMHEQDKYLKSSDTKKSQNAKKYGNLFRKEYNE